MRVFALLSLAIGGLFREHVLTIPEAILGKEEENVPNERNEKPRADRGEDPRLEPSLIRNAHLTLPADGKASLLRVEVARGDGAEVQRESERVRLDVL